MGWTGSLAGVVFLALALYACDSTGSSGGVIAPDASTDSPDDDGGLCCAPDPRPGCCMNYGGKQRFSSCGRACDGMPVPSDPDWKIVTDELGCPRWTNPHDSFHGGTSSATTDYCGAPPRDDAGSNDASDAD